MHMLLYELVLFDCAMFMHVDLLVLSLLCAILTKYHSSISLVIYFFLGGGGRVRGFVLFVCVLIVFYFASLILELKGCGEITNI